MLLRGSLKSIGCLTIDSFLYESPLAVLQRMTNFQATYCFSFLQMKAIYSTRSKTENRENILIHYLMGKVLH